MMIVDLTKDAWSESVDKGEGRGAVSLPLGASATPECRLKHFLIIAHQLDGLCGLVGPEGP